MYIPPYSEVTDLSILRKFIEDHSFGTLITSSNNEFTVNHFPFLLEPSGSAELILVTHLAKTNPQWRVLEAGQPCIAVFQGPNAYISPSFYIGKLNVPTWNYTAVHVTCQPEIVEDEGGISEILNKTVEHFEKAGGTSWRDELPSEFRSKLSKAIVGVILRAIKVEGKFKLSQNRGREDYQSVIKEFEKRLDDNSRELLKYMRLTTPEAGGRRA